MSAKSEFPNYDGELYIPEGFVDNSYHNDTMPRASKGIGDDIIINIWQDYVNENKRENKGDTRYIFQIEVGWDIIFDFHTDNLKVIKKLVHSLAV